jgi:hypothetical protein
MFRKTWLFISLLAVSPAMVAFHNPSPVTAQQSGEHWWAWALVILIVLIELWWCLSHCLGKKAAPAIEVEAVPDDLQLIEGIGPKIAGLLQEAGIATFARLAATDVGRLEQIVRGAGITIADPSTWPEQARLASAGKWAELDVLQEELKGGRRV